MAADIIARGMAGNAKKLLDEYKNNPDVADIVQNKAALDAYDTSKLSENDVVKVLDDESENHMQTYYKWVNNNWNYIGGLGPYYNQNEIDNLLLDKVDKSQIGYIELDDTLTTGTLTSSQLTTITNAEYFMLIRGNQIFQKVWKGVDPETAEDTFDFAGKIRTIRMNNQYTRVSQDYIYVNLTTGVWSYSESVIINTYINTDIDTLLLTKQPTLISGTNIKTVNGQSILGNGNLETGVNITDGYSNNWSIKTWNEFINFDGSLIWTDGENIYYSQSSNQYILDKATSTWITKIWIGLTNFYGSSVWTDGENIYYSFNSDQYILNKSTSTWSNKTWIGLTSFAGSSIWTDGENIYYSGLTNQYVLDKTTSTWSQKTWTGLTNFDGQYIWTDGENIYYSQSSNQYVLDKSTSTWSTKTWTGLTSFSGTWIWTDGDNIYYSGGSSSYHYVLDKATSSWSTKTWTGIASFVGSNVWTDGDNIYYSNNIYGGNDHYILLHNIKSVTSLSKVAETGSYNDLKDKPEIPNPIHLYHYDITIYASEGNYCVSFDDTEYTINTVNDFGAYLMEKGYNASDDYFLQISGGLGSVNSMPHGVFGIYAEFDGSDYELNIAYGNNLSGVSTTSLSIDDFYCKRRKIF